MKLINVMAGSLDGRIGLHPLESDADRRRYGFTNNEDREFVRTQIEASDAIITGANSMRASRTAWRQKGLGGKYPLWVVMTRLGLDSDLGFWNQAEIDRWVVSPQPLSMPPTGAKNLTYGQASPARFVYDQLKAAGAKHVLLFGGGYINRLFYEENLVDELRLTLCPIVVGRQDAPSLVNYPLHTPKALRLLSSHLQGSHVFLHYEVIKK